MLPLDSEPGGAGAAPAVVAVVALRRPSAQLAPNPRDANASDRAPCAAESAVGLSLVWGSAGGGADCAERGDSSARSPDACLAGCIDDSAISILGRFGTGDSSVSSSLPCADDFAWHSARAERESSPTIAQALSEQDLSEHFPAVRTRAVFPRRAVRSARVGLLSACGVGTGGVSSGSTPGSASGSGCLAGGINASAASVAWHSARAERESSPTLPLEFPLAPAGAGNDVAAPVGRRARNGCIGMKWFSFTRAKCRRPRFDPAVPRGKTSPCPR